MRACFLGQNVTALGFGVAMLQTPPLPEPDPPEDPVNEARDTPDGASGPEATARTAKDPQAA